MLLMAGMVAVGCGKGDNSNVPPRLVKVFVVGELAAPQAVEKSQTKGDLSFDASGKVIEVLVSQGAKVVPGQTLARLIPTSMAMSESSSLISYRAARAELQSAELEYFYKSQKVVNPIPAEKRQSILKAWFPMCTKSKLFQ